MIDDINLDYFKIFFTVANEGNLTKASEKLYISQPAITQTIQKLEKGLNLQLFIRNKKGVILTKEGQLIFEELKNAKQHLLAIEKIADDCDLFPGGTLKIGCGSNISRKVLLKPIIEFNKKYPSIQFAQIDKPQSIMLEMLDNCNLDICISQYNEEQISKYNFLPILEEKFVFACSPLYLENLEDKFPTFIVQGEGTYNRKTFENFIKSKNINNYSTFQSVGYNLAIELALQNFGISLVPYYLIESHIKQNKLTIYYANPNEKVIYGVYTNKNIKSKKIDAFIEYLNK